MCVWKEEGERAGSEVPHTSRGHSSSKVLAAPGHLSGVRVSLPCNCPPASAPQDGQGAGSPGVLSPARDLL